MRASISAKALPRLRYHFRCLQRCMNCLYTSFFRSLSTTDSSSLLGSWSSDFQNKHPRCMPYYFPCGFFSSKSLQIFEKSATPLEPGLVAPLKFCFLFANFVPIIQSFWNYLVVLVSNSLNIPSYRLPVIVTRNLSILVDSQFWNFSIVYQKKFKPRTLLHILSLNH